MKEKLNSHRKGKKHAFFPLEEEIDPDNKKPKYIAKIPNAVGKQNFFSCVDRFNDQYYSHQSNSQSEPNQHKNLVIKIMPAKSSPRALPSLKRQILYIGRLSEGEAPLNLELLEKDTAFIGTDPEVKMYDQNFKIIGKAEAETIATQWLKDCKKNEIVSRHILLSIGGKEDKNKTLAITKLFLEDVFRSKGYDYFFAAHNDTVNDHFHVIIKKKNNLGQNLRFNKNDVFILRQKYANYLEKVGIKRSILARRDKKEIIQKVREGIEHMKNDNSWYQSKLNKGNQKDFNAYNYKANIAGRIEEIIGVLTIKNYLKTLGVEGEGIINRLKPNLKKNGLKATLDSLLAVKQMQEKKLKINNLEGIIIQAVEKMFKPAKEGEVIKKEVIKKEQKIYTPELTQTDIRIKFKEAVLDHFSNQRTGEDLQKHFDKALMEASVKNGVKIRFGDKNSCEIVWYGDGGYVLDYRGGEVFKWNKNKIKYNEAYEYKEVSQEEIAQKITENQLAKERIEEERREFYQSASTKAQELFDNYNNSEEKSSYLVKKGIADLNIKDIKIHNGKLVVPIMDTENKIWSLQYIDEDSSKKFLKNGKKQGNFFILQDQNKSSKKLEEEGTIFLAEGLATAATINKAVGSNVVVCFDAGNIKDVFVNLIAKFPDKKFVIAADNDLWGSVNTGKNKAEEIIQKYQDKINVKMILPQFTYEHKDFAPTDFNDLHALSGIAEVRKQLLEGMIAKVKIEEKKDSLNQDDKDKLIINSLKILKECVINSEDKKVVKNRIDETIKSLKNIDEKLAKEVSDKINNDNIRYSYIQSKKEVKYLNKIKQDQGLKISS